MAWTAPYQWTTGHLVTAAELNAQLKNNMRYLKGLDGAATFESDFTVDNLITAGLVDGVDVGDHAANTTTAHGAVSAATASKIVVRDGEGQAKFAAPAENGDALIKGTRVTTSELPTLTTGKVWIGVGGVPAEGAAGPTIVRKTADKTLNNVAVLENDNHLLMAIGANEVWQIDIFILCMGNATADIQFGFSYPVDCLIYWGLVGAGDTTHMKTWGHSATSDTPSLKVQTENQVEGIHATLKTGYRLSLIVISGANAGNINLQWAQAAAQVGDTIVYENSCIVAHQLA